MPLVIKFRWDECPAGTTCWGEKNRPFVPVSVSFHEDASIRCAGALNLSDASNGVSETRSSVSVCNSVGKHLLQSLSILLDFLTLSLFELYVILTCNTSMKSRNTFSMQRPFRSADTIRRPHLVPLRVHLVQALLHALPDDAPPVERQRLLGNLQPHVDLAQPPGVSRMASLESNRAGQCHSTWTCILPPSRLSDAVVAPRHHVCSLFLTLVRQHSIL